MFWNLVLQATTFMAAGGLMMTYQALTREESLPPGVRKASEEEMEMLKKVDVLSQKIFLALSHALAHYEDKTQNPESNSAYSIVVSESPSWEIVKRKIAESHPAPSESMMEGIRSAIIEIENIRAENAPDVQKRLSQKYSSLKQTIRQAQNSPCSSNSKANQKVVQFIQTHWKTLTRSDDASTPPLEVSVVFPNDKLGDYLVKATVAFNRQGWVEEQNGVKINKIWARRERNDYSTQTPTRKLGVWERVIEPGILQGIREFNERPL